jgi:hypothetical protein
MDDKFRIERYRRSNREQVFDLMRAAYRPHEVAREMKQWDWKHDSNPFNAEAERYRIANRPRILSFVRAAARPEDTAAMESQEPGTEGLDQPYCIMLKTAEEQLAGLHCMMPQRFRIGGGWHWANIGSNFIVHPAYRGQGLSIRLSLTTRADNALNLNFTNQFGQRSSRSVVRLLRGKASGGTARNSEIAGTRRLTPLFKPIDWSEVVGYFSRNGIVKRSAALLGAGIEAARRKIFRSPSTRAVDIVEVDSFDDRIDALWPRVCRDYPVMAARDSRYLNWRFLSRPDVSYRYLLALQGEHAIGYMVFRVGARDAMLCGYVVDYLVENRSREFFSLLLERAEKLMSDEGAKALICAVASAPYRSTLWRSGYFAARTASTSHMNVLCHTGDRALEVFTDLSKWFLTMGDGDLDFSY